MGFVAVIEAVAMEAAGMEAAAGVQMEAATAALTVVLTAREALMAWASMEAVRKVLVQ